MYSVLRHCLFCLPPEYAHALVLWLLDRWYSPARVRRVRDTLPEHPVRLCGLRFPNPIGLAAGLDKDGEHMDALFALGVGFIEVGAVTPQPQSGNPRPRLFRLSQQQALINRMGFNNRGVDALLQRLRERKVDGIVGVNIGKNRDTPLEKAAEDYVYCYRALYREADFVTLNISSPNTAELTRLQAADYLPQLLQTLQAEQQMLQKQHGKTTPLWVKISPDLSDAEIDVLAEIFLQQSVDGIIATNTTRSRDGLDLRWTQQVGGLSGRPLFHKTQQVVQRLASRTQQQIPIIAVGGVASADDARSLLAAGASLVQLYTALIYQGPALIQSIVRGLS